MKEEVLYEFYVIRRDLFAVSVDLITFLFSALFFLFCN